MGKRMTISEAIFEASDELRDIEGIPNRIPDQAKRALARIASKLRADEPLTSREREYLAAAIQEAVNKPAAAGAALGLIQGRSRGRKDQDAFDAVAAVVAKYHIGQGVPLKDSREGSGAFALAAEELHMEVPTVRDHWERASLRHKVKT